MLMLGIWMTVAKGVAAGVAAGEGHGQGGIGAVVAMGMVAALAIASTEQLGG